jgi:YVTN family beta-propeller protein
MEKLLFSTDTDSGTVSVINLSPGQYQTMARINVGNGPRGAVRFTGKGNGFVSNHLAILSPKLTHILSRKN